MALGDAHQIGYESFLGVAKEASWGTPVTATNFLEYTGEALQKTQEGHILEAIGSTGRYPQKRYLGNVEVGGSVECPLNIFEDACCLILNNAMGGTITSSGDATNGYNHVLTPGNMQSGTTALTLTKRIGSASDLYQYAGCRVNQLTIKGEVGTPEIMMTAEFIGKDGTISTDTLTVALAAEDPLLWSGVTFEVADTTTSFDGSTNAETIQAFELTINNNLVGDDTARQLGSNQLGILPPGRAQVSLKITQRYETSTAYSRAMDETQSAVRISLDTGVTLGSEVTGTTGSLMFTMAKTEVEVGGTQPETGETGVIPHELTFTPLRPTSTQNYIDAEYNNNTASY